MGRPKEVTDAHIIAIARRCFLARGAGVSAAEIAKEVGVSHTTVFNRFGSKEGLMLAALGPPAEKVPWVEALERGPDRRPIKAQLIEHAKVMSVFFQDLQAGFGVLQAAGIQVPKAPRDKEEVSPPEQAYRALVGWLTRAQVQGRLGACDIPTLAETLLGALQGAAFTSRVCGLCASDATRGDYVDRLIELLWSGIGSAKR